MKMKAEWSVREEFSLEKIRACAWGVRQNVRVMAKSMIPASLWSWSSAPSPNREMLDVTTFEVWPMRGAGRSVHTYLCTRKQLSLVF